MLRKKIDEPKKWAKLCIIEIIIIIIIIAAILCIKNYFDRENTDKIALKVLVNNIN